MYLIFVAAVPFHPHVSRLTLWQYFLIDNRLVLLSLIYKPKGTAMALTPSGPRSSGGFFDIKLQ